MKTKTAFPLRLEGFDVYDLRDCNTHVEALVRYNDGRQWITLESRAALNVAYDVLYPSR